MESYSASIRANISNDAVRGRTIQITTDARGMTRYKVPGVKELFRTFAQAQQKVNMLGLTSVDMFAPGHQSYMGTSILRNFVETLDDGDLVGEIFGFKMQGGSDRLEIVAEQIEALRAQGGIVGPLDSGTGSILRIRNKRTGELLSEKQILDALRKNLGVVLDKETLADLSKIDKRLKTLFSKKSIDLNLLDGVNVNVVDNMGFNAKTAAVYAENATKEALGNLKGLSDSQKRTQLQALLNMKDKDIEGFLSGGDMPAKLKKHFVEDFRKRVQDGASMMDVRYVKEELIPKYNGILEQFERELKIARRRGDSVSERQLISLLKEGEKNLSALIDFGNGKGVMNIRLLGMHMKGADSLTAKSRSVLKELNNMTAQLKGNIMPAILPEYRGRNSAAGMAGDLGYAIRASVYSLTKGVGLPNRAATAHMTLAPQGSGKAAKIDMQSLISFADIDTAEMVARANEGFYGGIKSDLTALLERGEISDTLEEILEEARSKGDLDLADADFIERLIGKDRAGKEALLRNSPGLRKKLAKILVGGTQHKNLPAMDLPGAYRGYLTTAEMLQEAGVHGSDRLSAFMSGGGKYDVMSTKDGRWAIKSLAAAELHEAFGGFDFDDSIVGRLRKDEKGNIRMFASRQPNAMDEFAIFNIQKDDLAVEKHIKREARRILADPLRAAEHKLARKDLDALNRVSNKPLTKNTRKALAEEKSKLLKSIVGRKNDIYFEAISDAEVKKRAVKAAAYRTRFTKVNEEMSAFLTSQGLSLDSLGTPIRSTSSRNASKGLAYTQFMNFAEKNRDAAMFSGMERLKRMALSMDSGDGALGQYINTLMVNESISRNAIKTGNQTLIDLSSSTFKLDLEGVIDVLIGGGYDVKEMSDAAKRFSDQLLDKTVQMMVVAHQQGIELKLDKGVYELKAAKYGSEAMEKAVRRYRGEGSNLELEDLLDSNGAIANLVRSADEHIKEMNDQLEKGSFTRSSEWSSYKAFNNEQNAIGDAQRLERIRKRVSSIDGISDTLGMDQEDAIRAGRMGRSTQKSMGKRAILKALVEDMGGGKRAYDALIRYGQIYEAGDLFGILEDEAILSEIMGQFGDAEKAGLTNMRDLMSRGTLQGGLVTGKRRASLLSKAVGDDYEILNALTMNMGQFEVGDDITEQALKSTSPTIIPFGNQMSGPTAGDNLVKYRALEFADDGTSSIVMRTGTMDDLLLEMESASDDLHQVGSSQVSRSRRGVLQESLADIMRNFREVQGPSIIDGGPAASNAMKVAMGHALGAEDSPGYQKAREAQRVASEAASVTERSSASMFSKAMANPENMNAIRKIGIAGGALAGVAMINMFMTRDRTADDITGPPNLPGGNPYDQRQQVGLQTGGVSGHGNNGQGNTYVVRSTGGRAPNQNLLDSIFGATGADVTLRADVNDMFAGDYARDTIMSRF